MKRMSFIVFYTYEKELGYGKYTPIQDVDCFDLDFEEQTSANDIFRAIESSIKNRIYGQLTINSICKVNEYILKEE